MKRTAHYTCRHSCNCDGCVHAYLLATDPTRRFDARQLAHDGRLCAPFLPVVVSLSSFLQEHRHDHVQRRCFSRTGNTRPDIGVTRVSDLKCNPELYRLISNNCTHHDRQYVVLSLLKLSDVPIIMDRRSLKNEVY